MSVKDQGSSACYILVNFKIGKYSSAYFWPKQSPRDSLTHCWFGSLHEICKNIWCIVQSMDMIILDASATSAMYIQYISTL